MFEKNLTVDKKWTLDEALEAQRRAEEASPDGSAAAAQPLFQWCALHKLDELEKLFNAGDNFSLLLAIKVCASDDLVIPDWASRAYIKRVNEVLFYRARSWDKVFGAPFPKGKHLASARKCRSLRFVVYNKVRKILEADPSIPIDENLFERVGKKYGISRSLANKLYYEVNKSPYGIAIKKARIEEEEYFKRLYDLIGTEATAATGPGPGAGGDQTGDGSGT